MLALGNSADNGEVNAYIRVDLQIHLGQTGIYEFRRYKAVFDAGKAVFLGVEVTLGGPGRGDGEALHLGKDGLARLCVPGPENTEAVIHQLRHRAGDGHCLQLRAVLESTDANAGDALRNVDGGQSGTVVESVVSDAFKGAGQADGGQIPAQEESVVANGGDALFHNNTLDTIDLTVPGSHDVTAVVRHGAAAADGHGAVLGQLPGEVLAAGTAENLFGVSQIDPAPYRCLAGVGQLFGGEVAPNDIAGAVFQAHEQPPGPFLSADCSDIRIQKSSAGNCSQFSGFCKRIVIIGQIYIGYIGVAVKNIDSAGFNEPDVCIFLGVEVSAAGPLAGHLETGNGNVDLVTAFVGAGAVAKGILANLVEMLRNGDLLQIGAVIECLTGNARKLIRESNLTETAAATESFPADSGTVRNCNGAERSAVSECVIVNVINTVGHGDGGQIGKIIERKGSNLGDTRLYHNRGDLLTAAVPGRGIIYPPTCGLIAVVCHIPLTADGEDVIVQRPGDVFAAAASRGLEDTSSGLEPAVHRLLGGIGQLFGSVSATPLDAAAALQAQNLIPGFVAHRPAGGVNRGAAGYGADAFGLTELFGIQGRILGNGLCLGIDGSDGEALFNAGEAVFLGIEVAPGAPCGSDLEERDLCGVLLGSRVAKSIPANTDNRAGDGDGGQLGAIQENACSKIPRTASQRDLGQSGAVLENTGVESFNIARNGDLGQAGAASEGSFANLGDAAQKVEGGQASAVFKGRGADVADGAAQGDGGQIDAVVESAVGDEFNAIFNHHAGDLIKMILPGGRQKLIVACAGSFDVAVHLALAADGQGAVLGQNPADIFTALA